MEVIIPLAVVVAVLAWSVKRFKPELWKEVTAKFKK
jgi:hypothetical protein